MLKTDAITWKAQESAELRIFFKGGSRGAPLWNAAKQGDVHGKYILHFCISQKALEIFNYDFQNTYIL